MDHMIRFAALFALSLLVLAPAALADAQRDLEQAARALQSGKTDEALVLLTKAIDSKEIEGNDLAFAHYNRGNLLSTKKKHAEALADFSKAIELLPDFGDAYHDRGLVHAEQKRYPEALDDFSRAVFLLPMRPDVIFNRGHLFELMGKKNEAIADYRLARQLAPKFKEPQDALRRLGAK